MKSFILAALMTSTAFASSNGTETRPIVDAARYSTHPIIIIVRKHPTQTWSDETVDRTASSHPIIIIVRKRPGGPR